VLKQILSPKEIDELVTKLGQQITMVHDPCVWIVMDGGFMFAADLLRKAKGVRSTQLIYVDRGYGEPQGPHDPHVYHMSHEPVFLTKYNHVFVDVVMETGKTFKKLLDLVPDFQRKSVVTCALVVKETAGSQGSVLPTLRGTTVPRDRFLTGYGMAPYRNLPYIAERREK
jgi:hypoxanthine phosphoribosyltransferase